MVQVLPVNLPYNVKTLWFDPDGLDVHAADHVVVKTARGLELGQASGDIFDVSHEEIKRLKSPLRKVLRIASDEDIEQAHRMEQLSAEALPIFKEMAKETSEDMHPVSVEYLLDGDKAIFYFEAEERIDFRDLVRRLASRFKVRVDMRQIGVRDEARIVGGLGHCGQIVCCKRLGGEFKPVSIRMAKDQDLSLNPQKISGLCGRLMCCLRYENDTYKDFKSHAPKVGNTVETPDGPAKVEALDVPREEIRVCLEGEKPVRVPLSAFEEPAEGQRPKVVSQEGWDEATAPSTAVFEGSLDIFSTSKFTGTDKLGSASVTHHEGSAADPLAKADHKKRRRRSKKVSGAPVKDEAASDGSSEKPKNRKPRRRSTKIGGGKAVSSTDGSKKGKDQADKPAAHPSGPRPGHKSSGLAHADEGASQTGSDSEVTHNAQKKRRRRRKRKPSNPSEGAAQ